MTESGREAAADEVFEAGLCVVQVLKARAAGLKITLVAAANDEWGIGVEGRLPWRCPEDLRYFKQRTMGRHLLMGRTTYEGLPKPLDGRTIHVLSRNGEKRLSSVERALHSLLPIGLDEVVIAGGGGLYIAALPFCTHAEVTRIPGTHGCDAFMPDLREAGWTLVSTSPLSGNINIEHWESKR